MRKMIRLRLMLFRPFMILFFAVWVIFGCEGEEDPEIEEPSMVESITASVNRNTITLKWDEPPLGGTATVYRIRKRTASEVLEASELKNPKLSGGAVETNSEETRNRSKIFANLPDGYWEFEIVALNQNVEGVPSKWSKAVIAAKVTKPPQTPTKLTVGIAELKITIDWQANISADFSDAPSHYSIEYKVGTGDDYQTLVDKAVRHSTTCYEHTGLDSSKAYQYRIIAYNAEGMSSASEPSDAVMPLPRMDGIPEESEISMRLKQGIFMGRSGYSVSGDASIVRLDDDRRVLILSANFVSSNGPGLYVYLATPNFAPTTPSTFTNLGALKSTTGRQVYTIPSGTDLNTINRVLVYCRPYSIPFGSADLSGT